MKPQSSIIIEGDTPSGSIGNAPSLITKPTIDYMFSGSLSFGSFLDYETNQVLERLKQDSTLPKDLSMDQSIANVCMIAVNRSGDILLQNAKKIQELMFEVNTLRAQNCSLKAISQQQKNSLEQTIKVLKREIQSLKNQNTQIKTIQKDKIEVQKGKIQDENKKLSEELAKKNTQIENFQQCLEIEQKNMKAIAQNLIDALNILRPSEKKIRQIKQTDGISECFKFCIAEVEKNGQNYISLSKNLYNLGVLLKSLVQAAQQKQAQTALYSPTSLKEGQEMSIFKRIRQDLERKITAELKIKKGEDSPFNQLTQFLSLTDSFMKKVLKSWIQALQQANTNNSNLTNQNTLLIEQNDRLQKEIQQLTMKCQQLQAQNRGLQAELEKEMILKQKVQKELQEALILIATLKSEIDRLKREIEQLKRKLDEKDRIISSLEADLQTKKTQIIQKNNQIQRLSQRIKQLSQDLAKVKNELKVQIQKKQKIQKQNLKRSSIIVQNQGKLEQLTNKNKQLSNQNKSLDEQLKITQRQLQAFKQTVFQQTRTIDQNEKEIKQHHQNLIKAQNSIKALQLQKYQLQEKYDHLFHNPPREYLQYFNGHILNIENRQDVKWLIQNFEKYSQKTIRSTKPLYRMDLNNKIPFHSYIDHNPNIVLILRMNNGQIIVAYSAPGFVPKTNVEFMDGYMFGLRNKKVFRTKREVTNKLNRTNPKPITYDEFFLIWGNSDLRIKPASKELYSNYATASGSYEEIDNPNSTIEDLFQQEERDAFLADYEIFQVEFYDE